MNVINLSLS